MKDEDKGQVEPKNAVHPTVTPVPRDPDIPITPGSPRESMDVIEPFAQVPEESPVSPEMVVLVQIYDVVLSLLLATNKEAGLHLKARHKKGEFMSDIISAG